MSSLLRKPFAYTYRKISFILVGINVLVFIITSLYPQLQAIFGLYLPLFLGYHMYWQPLTYLFVHSSLEHLLFNMLALAIFGPTVEKAVGSGEFTFFYFFCGIVCGLLSLVTYFATGAYNALLIGASGALYAVLFLFAVIYPRSTIYIWGILPVPSPLLIVVYAVIEVISQFTGFQGSVAHLTHLYGFAAAWLYVVVRMGIHPVKVWKDAYRH
jgi:membrane associated rhomboid family serine protease